MKHVTRFVLAVGLVAVLIAEAPAADYCTPDQWWCFDAVTEALCNASGTGAVE